MGGGGGSKCHVTQKEKIIIKRGKEQKTGEKRNEWWIMNFSGAWVRFLPSFKGHCLRVCSHETSRQNSQL